MEITFNLTKLSAVNADKGFFYRLFALLANSPACPPPEERFLPFRSYDKRKLQFRLLREGAIREVTQ